MKLEILSPEKTIYSGSAESVTLPGLHGRFTVLDHHAPLISALNEGKLSYRVAGGQREIRIRGGFAEVKKNTLSVCAELNSK